MIGLSNWARIVIFASKHPSFCDQLLDTSSLTIPAQAVRSVFQLELDAWDLQMLRDGMDGKCNPTISSKELLKLKILASVHVIIFCQPYCDTKGYRAAIKIVLLNPIPPNRREDVVGKLYDEKDKQTDQKDKDAVQWVIDNL